MSNEILITPVTLTPVKDDPNGGWLLSDESGNVVEGPFETRAEARSYLDDLRKGLVHLSGSGRYHNDSLEKAYQAGLAKRRTNRKISSRR